MIPLEEGEIAKIDPSGIHVMGPDRKEIRKKPIRITWGVEATAKGGHRHFMMKEICEQHQTLAAELGGRVDAALGEVRYERLGISLSQVKKFDRVVIAACGTAWHSGLVARSAIEEHVRLPVEVGLASELRYGHTPFDRNTLMLAISQSGETADTLAAVRMAKEAGSKSSRDPASLIASNVSTAAFVHTAQ